MMHTILSNFFVQRYGYMLILLCSFLLGSFVFWKKAKEEHFDEDDLVDLIFSTVVWSLLFGRITYILINFEYFGLNIISWLSIWSQPGFYWFGLLIGIFASIIQFSLQKKWDVFQILDLSVIGISLSQAFMYLSMFVSSTSQGIPTQLPIGILFAGAQEPRHPVGLYAFIIWLALSKALWVLESKYRRFVWYQVNKGDSAPGFLFSVYLIFSGMFGGLLLFLTQSTLIYSGLSIDALLQFAVFLLGISILIYRSGLYDSNKIKALIEGKKKSF